MPAVVDTSAVLAALDRRDRDHKRMSAALKKSGGPLFLPTPALKEVEFTLLEIFGDEEGWLAFLDDVLDGRWRHEPVHITDLERARADLHQGFNDFDDALIAASARRLALPVATLNAKHFRRLGCDLLGV